MILHPRVDILWGKFMNVIGGYIEVWSVYNVIDWEVAISPWTRYAVGVTPAPPLYSLSYALVAGVPAKVIGWACECGLSLHFEGDKALCPRCGSEYQKQNETQIIRIK